MLCRQLQTATIPLRPWMLVYAEWLVLDCVIPPKPTDRLKKLRALSRLPLGTNFREALESNADFLRYLDDLQRGPLEAARAKFARRLPEYIDAHHQALADAKEAKDYVAVARIAEPALDRVFPKRADTVAATQVTISLTPQQLGALSGPDAPTIEATVEPAPADSAD